MSELEYKKGGGDLSPEISEIPEKIKNRRTGSKVIVIICLCAAILVLLFLSPLFNITEVRVAGNEKVATEAIINASGISTGTNIFKINPAKSEKQLATLAYVDKVRIVRKFPAIVEIQVIENKETAYVYFIGNYVGIDEKGKILEIKSKDSPIELPVILGTNVTEFGIGEYVRIDDEEKQKAIFEILKQLQINGISHMLKTIDVYDLNDIKFFTSTESTINMGSMDDIIYKISFLKKILEEPGDKRGAVIDMTNPEKVTYRGS